MDSVNTRTDNLTNDVQSVKSSLEFTQAQVEELITSDLRVKEVKVQIEDLGNKLDDLENRSDSKRGNFEEDDVQMPLKLVKELLKQQESTLKSVS